MVDFSRSWSISLNYTFFPNKLSILSILIFPITDLSEQLKESEDRIQELQIDLEACKDANEALKHHSEESFSRLVVSMEEKFEETLKMEKEQMETAFKLKAKEFKNR